MASEVAQIPSHALRLRMGVAIALIFAPLALAGCAKSKTNSCPSGTICPPGKECVEDACVSLACGDGVLDPELDEECDCGDSEIALRPPGCVSANNDRTGTCRRDCRLHCGDGRLNDEEICDGAPPPGQSCISLGFDTGAVQCTDMCTVTGVGGCRHLGWGAQSRPTGENLRALWGDNANDIYAVGWGGAVLHFDGARWLQQLLDENNEPRLSSRFFAIWGRSANGNIYIGGQGGVVLSRRESDTEWQEHSRMPQAIDVNGIWGSSTSDRLIAVGDDGHIWHYDGAEWTAVHTGNLPVLPSGEGDIDLHTVFGFSFDEVYAAGDDFSIFKYNGTEWTIMRSEPSQGDNADFNGLWGAGPGDVYAVGDSAKVMRLQQGEWREIDLGGVIEDVPLRGVWGSGGDSDNVIIVGNDGTTLHYNGSQWLSLRQTQPEHLYAMWGTGPSNLYTVGNSGRIARHTGMSWASFGVVTPEEINDVWGTSDTNIFAVGDDGLVLHYDGATWTPYALIDEDGVTIEITADLSGISGDSSGSIFITSDNGTVLSFDGAAWRRDSISGIDDLLAAWTNPLGTYVVGRRGTMARFFNDQWLQIGRDLTEADLRSVWGSGPDDIWIAGDYDEVAMVPGLFHIDESGIPQRVAIDTNDDLQRVWGTAPDDVYVAGKDGELWRYDGADWTLISTATSQDLRGLGGNDRGERFAVGSNGAVAYYDGQLWQEVRSTTFERINAVWAGERVAVMAGNLGFLQMLVFTDR